MLSVHIRRSKHSDNGYLARLVTAVRECTKKNTLYYLDRHILLNWSASFLLGNGRRRERIKPCPHSQLVKPALARSVPKLTQTQAGPDLPRDTSRHYIIKVNYLHLCWEHDRLLK